MTVKELKKILDEFPDDWEIKINTPEGRKIINDYYFGCSKEKRYVCFDITKTAKRFWGLIEYLSY